MSKASKEEKFERAARIRMQIEGLAYITQPIIPEENFLENPNLYEDMREKEALELRKVLSSYLSIPKILSRIECFDIAHLAGSLPTASMVTFINGEPEKSYYRHFKIRQKRGFDDIASLKEVAKRRAKYFKSWGKPDLIIVDGGKGQVSVFLEELKENRIPIIGLAKSFETIIIPTIEGENLKFVQLRAEGPVLHLIQRLRNEAHRFARRYHHHLVKKELMEY